MSVYVFDMENGIVVYCGFLSVHEIVIYFSATEKLKGNQLTLLLQVP